MNNLEENGVASSIDSFQSYQIATSGLQLAIWAAKDGEDIHDLDTEKILSLINKYDYQDEFNEILGDDNAFEKSTSAICEIIIEELEAHFDGWRNLYHDEPPLQDIPRNEMIAYLEEQADERARHYWIEHHAAYTDPNELGADGMPKNGCLLTLLLGGVLFSSLAISTFNVILEFA